MVFFALELVFFAYINKSVWVDEAYSIALIRHSWKDIVTLTAGDVHPPLYYFILKVFSIIFGESVFVMKTVSIIPMVLFVILSARFIKNEYGNKACILLLLSFISAKTIRVFQKLQFLNNNHLKMAKCKAFCRTCSRTNRVLEQVYYFLWY
jgi:uncharacterized membrane protein